ncbi:hypothetical protein [Leclercia adecarboxylata]|nr:hypothetical protein [Leclercia adecarboxylata]
MNEGDHRGGPGDQPGAELPGDFFNGVISYLLRGKEEALAA